MEKQYFKYGSGYVNIDSENLYLTNSGNWQEARDLKEKSPKTKRQNSSRILGNNIFLFIVFASVLIGGFFLLERGRIFLGGVVLLFFVLRYFQPEMGNRYKIPLSKIESIELFEKGITIHFRNETNETDKESIDNVDPKGFEILTQMNLLKS
ncbi:hypothetical protein [Flavobacterium alkalisoli]|uniref:hypothetical protein n=1 Tax=Flavobacterium alkalisoli TaxID=2602769 RepID=UPI003A8FFF3C